MSGCGCQDGQDCGCGGHSHALQGLGYRRYRRMGALTPEQAANQVFPSSKITKTPGQNQAAWNVIDSAAQAGQLVDAGGMDAYINGTSECAAVSGQNMLAPALLTVGGGLALKFAGLAGPAAPLVMLAGGIMDAFGAIFAHHAAAIKKEQSVLCAAVPAANQSLTLIQQAVQSGQATPQEGIAALQQLQSEFQAQVSSIMKGAIGSGTCNAACVMLGELEAACVELSSQFQDLITGAQQVVTAGGPNVTSPSGAIAPASSYASFYSSAPSAAAPASPTSGWLPIAALVFGAFVLFRSL